MILDPALCLAALLSMASAAPVREPREKRQAPEGVPDYVLKYAPLVYLHSSETYFPSDLLSQVTHTTPLTNFAPTPNTPNPLNLTNLSQLGADSYLTSRDDVSKDPEWIKGVRPDASGKVNNAVTTAVIVNDKGAGNVDVFYMYFYAYNYGGNVLGIKELNFGNHVGDWEHTMLRFTSASPSPQYVWYSQHANGQAFSYPITQKSPSSPDRPLSYSAQGSHANYAIPGTHDHTIPNLNLPVGVLEDHTDAGTLWDPLQSAWFFRYNAADGTFAAYDQSGGTPVDWLNFKGHWGDQEYPTSDKRQVKLFGQAKYSSGPTGPADKQLNRTNVCPDNGNTCILRRILVPRTAGDEESRQAVA